VDRNTVTDKTKVAFQGQLGAFSVRQQQSG
jgi:hypothetical protein